MRKMSYLSPTSITKFYEDQAGFYLNYLLDERPPKEPQTDPMALGSAFDAYVKSYLYERIYGKDHDPRFGVLALFEKQVEPHARDRAREAATIVFAEYQAPLKMLLKELNESVTPPRFEFDLENTVEYNGKSVPLLGKPDLFYTHKMGARIILDWKVNGYYSKSGVSPKAGYIRIWEKGTLSGHHQMACPSKFKGMFINIASPMNMVDLSWAQQLSVYMWLCGEDVGSEDCITAIDQVVCRPGNVRFAEHRAKVQKDFQVTIFDKAVKAWEIINSDHFFRNMSKEESLLRCQDLENFIRDPEKKMSNDDWYQQMLRAY